MRRPNGLVSSFIVSMTSKQEAALFCGRGNTCHSPRGDDSRGRSSAADRPGNRGSLCQHIPPGSPWRRTGMQGAGAGAVGPRGRPLRPWPCPWNVLSPRSGERGQARPGRKDGLEKTSLMQSDFCNKNHVS